MNDSGKAKHDLIYIPVKDSLFSQEFGHYFSFGIEVFEHDSLCMKVSDISTDVSFVTTLARQCTCGKLDPVHLYNVIEDSLGT